MTWDSSETTLVICCLLCALLLPPVISLDFVDFGRGLELKLRLLLFVYFAHPKVMSVSGGSSEN